MNKATICRSYTFEAAHFLPGLPPMHKCRRMHGHSYRVEVRITGELDKAGLVRGIEFGAMDLVMEQIITTVDHHVWNDKLSVPTLRGRAMKDHLDKTSRTKLDALVGAKAQRLRRHNGKSGTTAARVPDDLSLPIDYLVKFKQGFLND